MLVRTGPVADQEEDTMEDGEVCQSAKKPSLLPQLHVAVDHETVGELRQEAFTFQELGHCLQVKT